MDSDSEGKEFEGLLSEFEMRGMNLLSEIDATASNNEPVTVGALYLRSVLEVWFAVRSGMLAPGAKTRLALMFNRFIRDEDRRLFLLAHPGNDTPDAANG